MTGMCSKPEALGFGGWGGDGAVHASPGEDGFEVSVGQDKVEVGQDKAA